MCVAVVLVGVDAHHLLEPLLDPARLAGHLNAVPRPREEGATDGIGTPDPNPIHLVSWHF